MRKRFGVAVAALLAVGLFGAAPAVHAASPAMSDWSYNPTTGHFYATVDQVTWPDAEAFARNLKGHLVTIEDAAENDWLLSHFAQPWLWIGLNDRDQDGTWTWASGRKVTFTNWQDGEPDNWKGYDPLGEHVATLSSEFDSRWADISERWLGAGIVEVVTKPRIDTRNTLPIGTHDGTTDPVATGDACYANGWAWDFDSPRHDVVVRILAMRLDLTSVPREIWRGPAAEFREDLLTSGFGDGTAAFQVDLRPLIEYGIPYEIRVQGRDVQTGTWVSLDETPRTLVCNPF